MPLADLTALANLALDHLGEPYLTDYETDTGTTADAVRLHLTPAISSALEAHDWQFATRRATLSSGTGSPPTVPGWATAFDLPAETQRITRVELANDLALPNDYHLQGTWLYLKPSGAAAPTVEYIWAEVPVTRWPALFCDAVAFLLASRLAPKILNDGGASNAFLEKYAAIMAQARQKDAIDLHRKQNLGEVENMALDLLGRSFLTDEDINRGITYDTVRLHYAQCVRAAIDRFPWTWATRYATLSSSAGSLPGWGSKWTLPSNCVRVLRVERTDGLSLPNDYHVQGGFLYLPEADAAAPVLHYLDASAVVTDWSPGFKEAVVHLLASRIAPKLQADPNLSTALLEKSELAMTAAKRQNAIELHARANLGEVGNLALDLIGRSVLTDEDLSAGITYDAVNLHLDQVVRSILESHVWSFATRTAQLAALSLASTKARAVLMESVANGALEITAKAAGSAGNLIEIEILQPVKQYAVGVEVVGNKITITPIQYLQVSGTGFPAADTKLYYLGLKDSRDLWSNQPESWNVPAANYPASFIYWDPDNSDWYMMHETVKNGSFGNGSQAWEAATQPTTIQNGMTWTALYSPVSTPTVAVKTSTVAELVAAIAATPAAAALVTAANYGSSTGAATAVAVALTSLTGGAASANVFAPAYASAFNLPADCLRLLKIQDKDLMQWRNEFAIQGRHLLIEEALTEAPIVEYIASGTPQSEWPSTFKEAVVMALAVKLAGKLSVDPNVALSLTQRAEVALGRARSKDARETRSNENHGPRHLAARSGFVRARYGNSRPPY